MKDELLQAEAALGMGLADRAERLYLEVAERDPRDSIAVVGLARVALERADDARALRFVWRALEIDPDNIVAQRMARRLEEVLRTRGEPLPSREVDR